MNKQTINELYWLAEDLLSYTDLTGNYFDPDNAQYKLKKMGLLMAQCSDSKLQTLYNTLLEQTEVISFFDKASFSENVQTFYTLLEERNA